ncbi:hypothetical protein XELAEV_18042807mg [Xenopus laevis]|uniref:Uncharacterized protein n=1 Tax=Xenopus laevis TaxID=8355 RepID=A0A974C4I4_XENLA|nr:hypothetical protein XELAEV_18042807mg [Xenopus laevis]
MGHAHGVQAMQLPVLPQPRGSLALHICACVNVIPGCTGAKESAVKIQSLASFIMSSLGKRICNNITVRSFTYPGVLVSHKLYVINKNTVLCSNKLTSFPLLDTYVPHSLLQFPLLNLTAVKGN